MNEILEEVTQYPKCVHIETRIVFLGICSLGFSYQYVFKIEQKIKKKKKWEFGFANDLGGFMITKKLLVSNSKTYGTSM